MSGIQVNYQQHKDMLTDYKLNESTSEKYNLDSLSPSLFSFPHPLFSCPCVYILLGLQEAILKAVQIEQRVHVDVWISA